MFLEHFLGIGETHLNIQFQLFFSCRPTLFIGGSESDYIPVTDHDEIQEMFTSSCFSYVQGAGHWVHSQKPAEVKELMVDFLR